jgi:uncharacterized zinc-type alcohol dehydrogenase-like protein
MPKTKAYAALAAGSPLQPFTLERRDPGPKDVVIEIAYCGICHSDIHQARDEWGGATFPMVPGHEIVGRVVQTGKRVKRFKKGDLAGVGCFVETCRKCPACREGEEQYCEKHVAFTYGGTEMDGKTPTQGGYSGQIVLNEDYAFKVSKKLPLAAVAPLLCAGVTTWSPLKRFGVKKGNRVAIVGLGGLGHMGVKFARALGCHVTVLSTSPGKEKDARKLGAKDFVVTKDPAALEEYGGSFDFILDTVSAPHDYNLYLNLLKRNGTMVCVGVPPVPSPVAAFSLIGGRRRLAGSLIGGVEETQEMLDFCARKGIAAEVEVIPASRINEAYERTLRSDVKYRFVIDARTL